jgi:mono/diheme cytochrome c family protein
MVARSEMVVKRDMRNFTRLALTALLLHVAGGSRLMYAQAKEKDAAVGTTAEQALVERGKYIVEGVAMCERCHTQRDERGNPDRARWLMGGPTQTRPTYPSPAWAIREPRIAGSPPGTDAEIIRLLTTGISRTGRPPNPPMPPFRMTRQDAEAVLAYLKSLR